MKSTSQNKWKKAGQAFFLVKTLVILIMAFYNVDYLNLPGGAFGYGLFLIPLLYLMFFWNNAGDLHVTIVNTFTIGLFAVFMVWPPFTNTAGLYDPWWYPWLLFLIGAILNFFIYTPTTPMAQHDDEDSAPIM